MKNMYNTTYKSSKMTVKSSSTNEHFPNRTTRFQKQFYDSLVYLSKNASDNNIQFFYSDRKWGYLARYSDTELKELYDVVSYYTVPQSDYEYPSVKKDTNFGIALHNFAEKIRKEEEYRFEHSYESHNSYDDSNSSNSSKNENFKTPHTDSKSNAHQKTTDENTHFDLIFSSFSEANFPDTGTDIFSDMLKETV